MTLQEISNIKDDDIDFSDIPELDKDFWDKAKIVKSDKTEPVTFRLKKSVLGYFKKGGKGYQTRISRVLESYVQAHQKIS